MSTTHTTMLIQLPIRINAMHSLLRIELRHKQQHFLKN